MKKAIALALVGTMAVGLLAGCGGSASSSSAASDASSNSEASTTETGASGDHTINTTDPIELSISWWGGDSRHEAYQEAIKAFSEKYSNITVTVTYGAWSGWEDKKSAQIYSDSAEDIMQVNWNWLSQYSANADKFVDLNDYSDVIDLTQFSESSLEACTVGGALQAIPVSMTGRTFFWNSNVFSQAGIEVPTTYEELLNAGKTFQEKLGDDYYPLVLGEYDRMILMVFYLESNYGKAWVENNELQYTEEEIADGIKFINELEENHVIPTIATQNGQGIDANNSTDKSSVWIDGKYAGIFEWDSSANKYQSALADSSGFVVGQEIKFGDAANGGFSKVSMGLAISHTCEHPVEAAALINFLLNEEGGASIMGSECGIPNSAAGLSYAEAADKVKPLVKEANTVVMNFVDFQLDPIFESSALKSNPNGVYADVFGALSYGDYGDDIDAAAAEAAADLYEGVTEALEDFANS